MVKRVQLVNKHDVGIHYALFTWRKCEFCKQDFKKERGYKWPVFRYDYHYSCGDCSASVSHCNDQIDHRRASEAARMTGNPPPAPPMRTYGVRR